MAIDFPNSPTVGDFYTVDDRTWRWDGYKWAIYATNLSQTNYNAKGDLVVGTGNDTVGTLTAGSNGQYLTANSGASAGLTWSTLDLSSYATISGSEILTNKTLDLTDNTITGTLSEFNTAVSDADLVSRDGLETLTNKTLENAVFTGQISAPAGTASTVPILFQNGSVTTGATGGSLEYNGNIFYLTPSLTAVSGRAVIPASHYLARSSNLTLSNVNTAQLIYGVSLTVASNTTYEIDMMFAVSTTGTTSNSLGLSFGGTATLTSIGYSASVSQNATSFATLTSPVTLFVSTSANTTITSAVATATYRVVTVKGIVRVNASGTFRPQLTYSAAPGVAPVVSANSYIRMTPIGDGSVQGIGAWA